MYAEYLRGERFDVDEADEGRQALAKALGRRYDLIIMDTRLPGIDGYQLTQVLRRDLNTQAVPIVVVTGEGTSASTKRAWEAGANAVLVKPALPDAVLADVRRLLESTAMASGPFNESGEPQAHARMGHIRSRAHRRGVTITPPAQPPQLVCPRCDSALVYQRSHIGGVSAEHSEQWDYYECPAGCGNFQYRQRTRKVRQR